MSGSSEGETAVQEAANAEGRIRFRRDPHTPLGGALCLGDAYAQFECVTYPNDGAPHGYESVLDIPHTYTPKELRGRGVAARLCETLFEQARIEGYRVRPTCTYVSKTFLPQRPDLRELVKGLGGPRPPRVRSKEKLAAVRESQKVGWPWWNVGRLGPFAIRPSHPRRR